MNEEDISALRGLQFVISMEQTTLEEKEDALMNELRLVQDKKYRIVQWLKATAELLE